MSDTKTKLEILRTDQFYLLLLALIIIIIVTVVALWLHSKQNNKCFCFKFMIYSLFVSILGATICCLIADCFLFKVRKKEPAMNSIIWKMYYFFVYNNFAFDVNFSLHILLISVHRFLAVEFPFKSKNYWMVHHMVFTILVLWFICFIVFAPLSILDLVTSRKYRLYEQSKYVAYYVYFVISISTACFYARIAFKVKQRNTELKDSVTLRSAGANNRTIIFCFILGFFFITTNLPYTIDGIFFEGGQSTVYIKLFALIIDPVMFILKVYLERRCKNKRENSEAQMTRSNESELTFSSIHKK